MNGTINSGFIPVKVSLNPLAKVTAGFAKEVEDVNQYPAEIYNQLLVQQRECSIFLPQEW